MQLDQSQLTNLRAYADGGLGTRQVIEQARLHDFADLVIALAQSGLDFPKPAESLARDARLALARDILEPRLRHGA